ncbi:MAG: hypothetical protein HND47_19085 [Chloroflexi bacterium]|nr:hypothetical protein [Chloroflexota bacterium]
MRKAHSNILSAAFAVLIIVSLVAACRPVTPVPTQIDSSSAESPGEQAAEQEVWLDEAVDVLQFPPTGKFVVHFKSPMSPTSTLLT